MPRIVKIDFSNFIENTLPHFLRATFHVNWAYSLMRPLRYIHDIFYSFYEERQFFLRHTAQTVYVEHYLNAKYNIDNPSSSATPASPYNATNEDIYIVNNDVTGQQIYNKAEVIPSGEEIYVYNASEYPLAGGSQEYYLYNKTDVSLGDNFTVFVPNSIITAKPWKDKTSYITTVAQINDVVEAAVNSFKFAQITFNITNY
ncbi:MAG: hypothetical protein GY861_05470 [bacterium]|nr:hypothetical protein [bacterium]